LGRKANGTTALPDDGKALPLPDYVAGWLRKLRDDRKLLVYAAAQAQKAADFILGREFTGN